MTEPTVEKVEEEELFGVSELDDGAPAGGEPCVWRALDDYDLCVGVGFVKFRDESCRGDVGDCLAVPKQLVPVLLGVLAAYVMEFGVQGLDPHVALHGVLEAVVHVVAGAVAEFFQGGLHGFRMI